MNIKKLSILFCFVFMVMSLSAMNYRIKVLNTPTITINGKELKVGDWFDDQAIITWSKESQAMRVLSEDNRVYTLSAKLCKEIKAKKFSDFILYTKPLAARGNDSLTLKEALEEKFDNNFIMLDEIVVDLNNIKLSNNDVFYAEFRNVQMPLFINDGFIHLKREDIVKLWKIENESFKVSIYGRFGDTIRNITNHFEVEMYPYSIY